MEMSLNLVTADDPLVELRSLAATLEQALSKFPNLALKVEQLLFAGSDCLQSGLIEFRFAPAVGTGRMTISLRITNRLREIVAAAAAGDLKGLGVDE